MRNPDTTPAASPTPVPAPGVVPDAAPGGRRRRHRGGRGRGRRPEGVFAEQARGAQRWLPAAPEEVVRRWDDQVGRLLRDAEVPAWADQVYVGAWLYAPGGAVRTATLTVPPGDQPVVEAGDLLALFVGLDRVRPGLSARLARPRVTRTPGDLAQAACRLEAVPGAAYSLERPPGTPGTLHPEAQAGACQAAADLADWLHALLATPPWPGPQGSGLWADALAAAGAAPRVLAAGTLRPGRAHPACVTQLVAAGEAVLLPDDAVLADSPILAAPGWDAAYETAYYLDFTAAALCRRVPVPPRGAQRAVGQPLLLGWWAAPAADPARPAAVVAGGRPLDLAAESH